VASLLPMAGLIACKDASLIHAFLSSRPLLSMFYKLLEFERSRKLAMSVPTIQVISMAGLLSS
jgi:hypothetical protein